MLWPTLLKMVDEFIDSNPHHDGVKTIYKIALSKGMTAAEHLQSIDVRTVGELRDLVPEAFPRVLRRTPLKAEQNIHGAWRVVPDTGVWKAQEAAC